MKSFLLFMLISIGIVYSQSARIVRLSTKEIFKPAEPSVAINPVNPDNIIAATLQFSRNKNGPRVFNTRYHSKDGGKTWKIFREANPNQRSQGDDALAFSYNGNAYHSYISFSGLRSNKHPPSSGIFVTRSGKDTDNWLPPVVVTDHINSRRPFEDKPYLVVDNALKSKYKGNVYITWTRFDKYGSSDPTDSTQIYFSRSLDQGKTFKPPYRISDRGGDCKDDDNTVEGAVPAVGSNGEIYVIWAAAQGLVFDKSLDGGKTFGKDKLISDLVGGWNIEIPGISRHNGFPITKVDLSNKKYKGRIYVNWIDERNGDTDVFLKYSQDGGKNWSKIVRVNDDSLKNGKAQFFTWMSVDPRDGSVNIIFYDRRNFSGTRSGLTLARSINGGETFVNHQLPIASFICSDELFFGDYSAIDAYDGRVIAVFPHFTGKKELAISAAIYHFKPGSQKFKVF